MRFRILLILFITAAGFSLSADNSDISLKRYGLYIGANFGGSERVLLRYAESDARAIANVMSQLGGVTVNNETIIVDPDISEINRAFADIKRDIIQTGDTVRKIEFIFYYSGHSDESGILLGEEKILYNDLRNSIEDMDADINIAILDSCSSGAFTRLKGGSMQSPFLVDESSDMTGHAYLTSSSEDEAAQESDQIQASFFTYYLVSALRGAADTSQDGKVTLNEAYSFAFNETLARTENTQAGAQNPSYQFDLTGSGELVLTDMRISEASIFIDKNIGGRFYVRDNSGKLITELRKVEGTPVTLSLPSGSYSITLDLETELLGTDLVLRKGMNAVLDGDSFEVVERETTRIRGDSKSDTGFDIDTIFNEEIEETIERALDSVFGEKSVKDDEITIVEKSFGYSLFPGFGSTNEVRNISINFMGSAHRVNGFEIGFINFTENIAGFQGAALMNITPGSISGFQAASIFNIAGSSGGAGQAAGVFNISEGPSLLQLSGVFNISEGNMNAFQGAGIFNIVENETNGAQLSGIFNITEKSIHGAQISGVFNITAEDVYGVQTAGVFNISEDLFGAQISLVNAAENIVGGQIGLVNVGKDVKGVQIGLVNINDDIDGIPIGLLNISKNGLHNVSLWYNEDGMTNLGFQFGSSLLYSLIYAGVPYEEPDKALSFGVGMGVHLTSGSLYLDTDLSAKKILTGTDFNEITEKLLLASKNITEGGLIPSLRLTAGMELFGSAAIFGGVVFDGYLPGITLEKELSYTREPWLINFQDAGTSLELYPSWFFGLRI